MRKIILTGIITILYIQVYSQTSIWDGIIYHGWPKDSVIFYHLTKISPVWDSDSSYIFNYTKNDNELVVNVEYKSLNNSNRYKTDEYLDKYYYFENDKLVISHSDFYGKKINEHPVDEFLEWVGQITEVNHGQMKIYLTNDEKIYNKFSYQNLKKSISLKGTQLHAIQRYGNFYVETVLLYIDGNFHIHSIHRSNDNDAYIRKDNPMYEWMIKNGIDKSYGAYII